MTRGRNNSRHDVEVPISESILASSFTDFLVEKRKEIGYAVAAVVTCILVIFYVVDKKSETSSHNQRLANAYANELVAITRVSSEDSQVDQKEREMRYNKALVGLKEIADKDIGIKKQYSGILAEALLLDGQKDLAQDYGLIGISKLNAVNLQEYATFSEISELLQAGKLNDAVPLMELLRKKIAEKNDIREGVLVATLLLQEASVARIQGDEEICHTKITLLRDFLTSKDKIEPVDADKFFALMQDKNASILDFLENQGK